MRSRCVHGRRCRCKVFLADARKITNCALKKNPWTKDKDAVDVDGIAQHEMALAPSKSATSSCTPLTMDQQHDPMAIAQSFGFTTGANISVKDHVADRYSDCYARFLQTND